MPVTGADISKWQGEVNFATLSLNAKFVFIKLSEGTVPDQRSATNWQKSQGYLPRGGYNYFHPELGVAVQLDTFLAQFGGDIGELPAVVDVESPRVEWSDTYRANLKAMLEGITIAHKRKPIVYTGNWFIPYIGAADWLAEYDLWLAQYTLQPPTPKAIWAGWKFWQYTSQGKGSLYGVSSTAIDLNRFNGEEEAFAEYVHPK